MLLFFIFLFGLIVGSFLNVVIYRYNTGHTIGGRSRCLSCGHTLRWYELIPVLSYVIQRGRCRRCKTKVSVQYPLVELLTAILFTMVFWQFTYDLRAVLYYWVITAILIVITIYDIRHTIIPDGLVYAFILLAFARPFILSYDTLTAATLLPQLKASLLAGGIFFAFFASLWLLSRGRAMGFGDAKLALGIGFLLGLNAGFEALMVAFWLGAVIGLVLILASRLAYLRRLLRGSKSFTMKSEVPFAPFLIIGMLTILLATSHGLIF